MENIKLSGLNPAGSELFMDSESFLQDLSDTDAMALRGGEGPNIHGLLQFGLGVYAIQNVISLVKSISAVQTGRK
ncbi:hypothetical protein [Nostoc sp. MG11]|uniref:hypothetical protein n=1 Tax=Nostoc sp. MG11 TaxID=2721166 RepID=UPI0018669B6F|nr:hypothetical protein [Nostoc sp. MG11]